jgi:hypothetical protein
MSRRIEQLTDAMQRTQTQIEESQRQLNELRKQLTVLQQQMQQKQAGTQQEQTPSDPPQSPPDAVTAQLQEIRERQAIEETQIATQEQTKVESQSRYPVKITGLILFNGFVNTRAVDMPATPTLAIPGSGSTGASVRQTVLGFDARGPHLFGASSYADLRVDFNGSVGTGTVPATFTGYYNSNVGLLRLRTAHAGLQWENTEAYFSLDKPIVSPDSPASLTAVAQPALAWSGNLWTWNPQLGATQDLPFGSNALRLQAALIDVADAPASLTNFYSVAATPPTSAQQSRWPGVQARIALLGSKQDDSRDHFGIGGYFSPHVLPSGRRYDAWAATMDSRFRLTSRLQLTASVYRGLGLGGLGGGGYKDYAYFAPLGSTEYYFRPLSAVGGWTELKEKWSERVESNVAFGVDNVFARELRPYAVPGGSIYQNLARNRTYTANVIYSPSAYLLFSLEYRRLESSPVNSSALGANVVGLAAGYEF